MSLGDLKNLRFQYQRRNAGENNFSNKATALNPSWPAYSDPKQVLKAVFPNN